ncbi:DUF485 domain-containing protein [Streptomyces aquilus]|uniref:DUF485 domain-containing protein n=1 Tax=Streptomyces aquilus TaxID=2548456 RepID=UPI001416FB4D|nr:DUF485 domain-containing protein [Streptomyces aquilus]
MSVPPPMPGSGPPSDDRPHEAVAGALQQLPRTLSDARRRFLALNGAAFLLTALLSGTVGELSAIRLASRMPLGVVLAALQMAVLLLTSWWYDRTLRRHADPLVDSMRRHAELVHPSLPQPGSAAAMSRWPYSSQGRQR